MLVIFFANKSMEIRLLSRTKRSQGEMEYKLRHIENVLRLDVEDKELDVQLCESFGRTSTTSYDKERLTSGLYETKI